MLKNILGIGFLFVLVGVVIAKAAMAAFGSAARIVRA